MNLSRAIGPALGGVLIAQAGSLAPFWTNAVSNLGVIVALLKWRTPEGPGRTLPVEGFRVAMRTGLRYARNSPELMSPLVRSLAFFPFASAYWALLPLLTRSQVAGGPFLYGVLLGAIGASAVALALVLPRLEQRLGSERLVLLGSLGSALALCLFAAATEWRLALAASLIAGAAWIATVASLNVSAQLALPDWVRGRGLAIFVSVSFGSMAAGSVLWGAVADFAGLPAAHLAAAAGLVLGQAATRRWRLQTNPELDLTPSMHWPAPVLSRTVRNNCGPVLVTVEYRVERVRRRAFLTAISHLEPARRRDGAYAWGVFEDTADEGRFLESFLVESWLEHLRQRERTTNADRVLYDEVLRLAVGGSVSINQYISAEQS
jgi:hypothetical protein